MKYLKKSITIKQHIKTNKHQIITKYLHYLNLQTLIYHITKIY